MAGKEVGEMNLSDTVFGAEVKSSVLHAAVRAYLTNQRQGTQSTLTRTEVSGGGKKPWKQKGSGRARQGSTRAPQWTHGGVALGPKPRCYHIELNKKTKRAALCGALSSKVESGDIRVIDAIVATEYKTKTMVEMLKAIGAGKKAMIVLPVINRTIEDENAEQKAINENCKFVIASCANIPGVTTTVANALSVYDILNCDTLVIAEDAVKKIEEVYSK